MARKPPKPDDKEANPRKKIKNKSLGSAVEAARKFIDLHSDGSGIGYVKQNLSIDDRSLAIVRGSNVENAIEIALNHVLTIHDGERRSIFRSDGPLGTFSNKITMAYALNVYGPITKGNLDVIRHIRNVFAHAKRHVDFESKIISDLCEHLMLPAEVKTETTEDDYPKEQVEKVTEWSIQKRVFLVATAVTELSLLKFSNEIRRQEIIRLGGVPKKASKKRVLFDDSLP